MEVTARVAKALNDQEELARKGKPLRELSAATIADLDDVRALADRVPLIDRPPSVNARITRQLMRLLRWHSRRG